MGPRSDNRGYVRSPCGVTAVTVMLQWVHGPITVVMVAKWRAKLGETKLQWVHGPITVVMLEPPQPEEPQLLLQWVHGPITVVMAAIARQMPGPRRFNGSTVR